MKNPILSGSGYKLYLGIWLLITVIHGSVLYFYYHFTLEVAISDSLVHNFLLGAIIPGLWYVVQFASLSKDDISLATTHVGSALLTVFVWSSLSRLLLGVLFRENDEYLQFVKDSYIWRLIIGSLYYSISILIFYLIKYWYDMQSRANRELELKTLLKDSELRMLKSQINPHFIFNSLNSISALTLSEPKSAQKMVIKLSNFLRFSLGKDSTEMNSIKEEIDHLTHYIDIEKTRFGEKLKFIKQVPDNCLEVRIPNLILQPLIENAIKYGVYESINEEMIKLTCELKSDHLHVELFNTFDPTSISVRGEGIGIQNVKRRLDLVYGTSDLLTIRTQEKEYVASIKIPLESTNSKPTHP